MSHSSTSFTVISSSKCNNNKSDATDATDDGAGDATATAATKMLHRVETVDKQIIIIIIISNIAVVV